MDVSTDSLILAAMLPQVGQAGSTFSTSTIGVSSTQTSQSTDASTFGLDALLSLGQSETDTGYSFLATQGITSQLTVPQYDLASVLLNTSTSTYSAPAQSEEEQARELAAAQQALEQSSYGEYDEAESILQGILDDNPQSAVAAHTMGAVALDKQDYERAEQWFRRAHFLDPDRGADSDAQNARFLQQDDDKVFAHAKRMVANGETQLDGIRLLVNLTDRSPSHTEARLLLAENLIAQGDTVNGLQQFNRAIVTAEDAELGPIEARLAYLSELAPSVAYLRHLHGKAQLELGQYQKASETLAVATKLAGSDIYSTDEARAQVGLGYALLDRNDIAGAVAKFERAESLDNSNREVRRALAEGYLARARLKARAGAHGDAIQDYRLASQKLGSFGSDSLRKQIAMGAYSLGLTLEGMHEQAGEDIDEEVLAYQTAYDIDPDNTTYKRKLAETRFALGDQYLAEENYSAAASAYVRAYELYKNDETYKEAAVNALVLKGDDLMSDYDYDEAIEAYRQAYQIDVDDETAKTKLAEAYNTRGESYRTSEKYKLAAADFKEALHLFPDNATYQENYDSVKYYE